MGISSSELSLKGVLGSLRSRPWNLNAKPEVNKAAFFIELCMSQDDRGEQSYAFDSLEENREHYKTSSKPTEWEGKHKANFKDTSDSFKFYSPNIQNHYFRLHNTSKVPKELFVPWVALPTTREEKITVHALSLIHI